MLKSLLVVWCTCSFSLLALESVPGFRGNAVRFENIRDYLTREKGLEADFSAGFTVSLYCQADAPWCHNTEIIGQGRLFAIRKRGIGDGGFYFKATVDGDERDIVWTPEKFPGPVNTWLHLAMTYDPATGLGSGYLNGKFISSRSLPEAFPTVKDFSLRKNNYPLNIGRAHDGAVDEVYIYNRVLTGAEIEALAAGQPPAGALAAYLMDDPADLGRDSSGHDRHLQVIPGVTAGSLPMLGSSIPCQTLLEHEALTVWPRPATEKTYNLDQPQVLGQMTEPLAWLARHEFESFQLVLSPRRPLTNVQVSVTPFRQGEHELSLELLQVDYVAVPVLSNTGSKSGTVFGEAAAEMDKSGGKIGYYPDPLPPLQPFAQQLPGQSYTVWVTVRSRPDSPAGLYHSQAEIKADGGVSLSLPLTVAVWDFTLPEQFHSTNYGCLGLNDVNRSDPEVFYRHCVEHYVTPTPLFADIAVSRSADGTLSLDTAAFDQQAEMLLGKYRQQVLYFPGWGVYNTPSAKDALGRKWQGLPISREAGKLTPEFKDLFAQYLRLTAEHLRQRGWLQFARFALTDEPHGEDDFAICREFAALVRNAVPEVKIMVTKWPLEQLIGAPDIWCLGFFEHDKLQEARDRGEKIEWYPNWHFLIDRPLMDSRMFGFLMWKYQISGIFFWKLNQGWNTPKALKIPQFIYPDGRILCSSGMVIYPDAQKLPIASIRWEMSRDAFEDYEYFFLLDELCRKNPDRAEAIAARTLMQQATAAIVPGYEAGRDGKQIFWKQTKWESDAGKLQDFRRQLAESILKLQ
ncbi:MAG: DUF4091 domain-containing protein [Oligosphaeraceae bacterium]|nr:DUF4091 domain-containing protein [Oligosphaeraceae bacterium]